MHMVLDRINFIDEFHLKEVILLDDEFLDRLGETFVIFDTCISQFFPLAVQIQISELFSRNKMKNSFCDGGIKIITLFDIIKLA